MSYNKLDIYNIAFELCIETHTLSLKLPNYELYELGSQLRRSAGSVVTNIAEGYGRNSYKGDFIRYSLHTLRQVAMKQYVIYQKLPDFIQN